MGPETGRLADRYELESLIAGGAMGQVFRARDTLLVRPVAVKVLRDQYAGDPTFIGRFRAEAQHAAALTHPHIASVFDYGEIPGHSGAPAMAYLVMELVEGESLAELLHREPRPGLQRTLDVLRQAADGLAAAHAAGVVHRDIKPANLLVGRDGRVKLTDFGIARSASSMALTGTGQVIGTAHYLSPEQASGERATPASDVYALGAVAYECLAGRRPFEGESPVQVAVMHIRDDPAPLPSDVPPAVRALVERAMAKDPAVRFPDGGALRDAVDGVLARAVTAPMDLAATAVLPAVQASPADEPPRRRRALVAGAVAAAGVAVAVGLAAALPDDAATAAADPSPSGTAAEVSAPAPTTPPGIEVAATGLVGRPVRDVQAELIAQGLVVELLPVETSEVASGLVTAADPAGTLAPGDVVRVSYAVPPVRTPTTTAPAPAPAPAPAQAGNGAGDNGPASSKGNGNRERGRGNGGGPGKPGDG